MWNWILTGVIVGFLVVGLDCGVRQRPEVTGFLLVCFVALFLGFGIGTAVRYLMSL